MSAGGTPKTGKYGTLPHYVCWSTPNLLDCTACSGGVVTSKRWHALSRQFMTRGTSFHMVPSQLEPSHSPGMKLSRSVRAGVIITPEGVNVQPQGINIQPMVSSAVHAAPLR